MGSDSGGSIRGPAKSCGVVGLKSTYGRISLHGVTALLTWTLDHAGPLARTVADVAHILQVIAGADLRDNACSTAAVPNYSGALTGNIKGLRLGVPTEYFFDRVHPETDRSVGILVWQKVTWTTTRAARLSCEEPSLADRPEGGRIPGSLGPGLPAPRRVKPDDPEPPECDPYRPTRQKSELE